MECLEDARKLENFARKQLTQFGHAHRGKRELFKCSPIIATKVIDDSAKALSISALKNFPRDFEELDKMGLDFIDLPYFLFDVQNPSQRRAYFKGAEAVLSLLGSLDGLTLTAKEIRLIGFPSTYHGQDRIEMWRIILDRIGCVVGRGDRSRLVKEAYTRIEKDHRDAFDRWQEIEPDDRDEAA